MMIVDEWFQLVLLHDDWWNVGDRNAHIFLLPWHWSVEAKIFNVGSAKLCIGRRQDTVQEEFDGFQGGHRGTFVALVLDTVATDSEADVVGFRFIRAEAGKQQWGCIWRYGFTVGLKHCGGNVAHCLGAGWQLGADAVGWDEHQYVSRYQCAIKRQRTPGAC